MTLESNYEQMKKINAMPPALGETAFCLAFYDWEKGLGSDWLNVIEGIFDEFGTYPWEGTGSANDGRESHGRYQRVRKRLASFLDEECSDIRVGGQVSVESDAFFPCDMRIVLGVGPNGLKQGMVAVRARLAASLERFVERIQREVFERTGATYATGFEFPAAYGPDAYLSSVSAVPNRMACKDIEYEKRLNRWRKRVQDVSLWPRKGFLREVYPINFLLEKHLIKPVGSGTLGEYANTVGDMTKCSFNSRMNRWNIGKSELNGVRQELEPCGFVLSSESEPVKL